MTDLDNDKPEEHPPEVFRGHLIECLRHLEGRYEAIMPKGKKGAGIIRKPLAAFCGVCTKTVTGWCRETYSTPLGGDTLIKLMCALDSMGYRVIEWERTPKHLRSFAELIGFGVLTDHEANAIVGYTDVATLNAALYGKQGISKGRTEIMWNTWKSRREELKQKKELAQKNLFPEELTATIQRSVEVLLPPLPSELPSSTLVHDAGREAAINIMHGLAQLIGGGCFDNLSAKELRLLRQANVRTIAIQLVDYLNGLATKLIEPPHVLREGV